MGSRAKKAKPSTGLRGLPALMLAKSSSRSSLSYDFSTKVIKFSILAMVITSGICGQTRMDHIYIYIMFLAGLPECQSPSRIAGWQNSSPLPSPFPGGPSWDAQNPRLQTAPQKKTTPMPPQWCDASPPARLHREIWSYPDQTTPPSHP